jgi:2,3-dimethylmalate lyase
MNFPNRNTSPTANRRRLRQLIAGPEILVLPGPYDAMSARLLAKMGFEGLWAGSLAGAASTLAVPDTGIMTMDGFLRWCTSLADASGLPVVCDCDNGYGGPVQVAHTVQAFERAGVAAIQIEDQASPKHCQRLPLPWAHVTKAEMVSKLRAAVDARVDESLMIWARCDVLSAGRGMSEALERTNAYADAGADGIKLLASNADDLAEFARQWQRPTPLFMSFSRFPQLTKNEVAAMGYKVMEIPTVSIQVALQAVEDLMGEFLETGSMANPRTRMKTFEDLKLLYDFDAAVEITERAEAWPQHPRGDSHPVAATARLVPGAQ